MSDKEIPGDLKFQKSHEWVRVEQDGTVTVGISDHAQGALDDLVYVELPEVGSSVQVGNGVVVVESVKAASDIYSPASGEVVEANAELANVPGDVNIDPMGKGWFFKMKLGTPSELDELMDQAAYDAFVKSLS